MLKKTPQESFYQGMGTSPPSFLKSNTKRTLSESSTEESVSKTNRVGPLKDLEECFFTLMRDRLEQIGKKTKTEDKTKELKNKLQKIKKKSLRIRTITNVAQLAKCDRKVLRLNVEYCFGLKNVEG
ncbi:hypothetical protein J3Q64DRAFT_1701581 [Phycomyces blakesleeanus]|uniref:Uncharacterized protein n=1 Tax=Phycomyces blakesleeanus TaxID=4837 RepID=A0ABR3AS15_PHYBL